MGEVRNAAITLSNSIIGVAILAMPYCYAQCGFVLATLLLILSGLATVQSCRMLLKSALATKRRSYEFLAHHVYGPLGKLAVEFSLIGLSIGTLVAFFVIIGDLCPQVLASLMRLPQAVAQAPASRAVVMATIGLCVILPLSLMRDPSILSKISAVSLAFYAIFMLHLAYLTVSGVDVRSPEVSSDRKLAAQYRLFRVEGLVTCLPIFSLAFTCQTQLFLLCDSLRDPSIKVMRRIINLSVFGCCSFYILIGSLGYVAFIRSPVIHGDLLAMYATTPASDLIKLGFVLSVAVSFPIIAFPCRVSIYSFIYLQSHHRTGGSGGGGGAPSDLTTGRVYIPDGKFRGITTVVVLGTLVVGLLIPNVEFILSLTGSVTGSVICYILPAGIYLNTFNGDRRLCCSLGCVVKWLGVATLCIGTAATLFGHGGGGGGGGGAASDVGSVAFQTRLPPKLPPIVEASQPVMLPAVQKIPPILLKRDRKNGDFESRQEPPLPDLPAREDDTERRRQLEEKRHKKPIDPTTRILVSASTQKPTLESTQKPTLKSTIKSTQKPMFESTSKPTQKSTFESTSKPTKKPTLESTHKSTLKPTQKPKSESTIKSTVNSATAVKNQSKKQSNDLEVLSELLREQQEQGRRIEEQLKKLEAVNAAKKQRERRSRDSSAKNRTQTSLDALVASANNSTENTTNSNVSNQTIA